jgi:L-gulonolactone oxidase
LRDGPGGAELKLRAEALAEAVARANASWRTHGVYDDDHVHQVNEAAARVTELAPRFSLSDVDERDEAIPTLFADVENLLEGLTGSVDHEGHWSGTRWSTWNNEEHCCPERFVVASTHDASHPYAAVQEAVRTATHLRVVGAGHSFNESSCTGGSDTKPYGTLLTLDRYAAWSRVDPAHAQQKYSLDADTATRVVRAQAGIRLRDFSRQLWDAGLALPLAGSTDAQSLGGLIATDLHGTGRDHGFLSEQLVEVTVVTGTGALVTLTRTPNGWSTDETPAQTFRWLPVAGALGTLGVVVDVVLIADGAYTIAKDATFIDRHEAERDLELLLARYDHVSFYYPGGVAGLRTVRMNTWQRSTRASNALANFKRLGHELFDHSLAAFAPHVLFDIGRHDARKNLLLRELNHEKANTLTAPKAFARKLFYLHDEIEYAMPVAHYRDAIDAVLTMLTAEEFKTIVEVRFTPDTTQAWIGPGTAGRGRGGAAWIELATSLGAYSEGRIAQVYARFDEVMRRFEGRPHLGKKTPMRRADMEALYGDDWRAFEVLRKRWDPRGCFVPPDNVFLQKLFGG